MKSDYPHYVWAVVPKVFKGCHDFRRYAYTHKQAIEQLRHVRKYRRGYKDCSSSGIWTLFKLVQVNKRTTKDRRMK